MRFQFSKSYSAAWDVCPMYAVLKEEQGRGDAGSLAAREGTESHTLFYGMLDGLIDDEQMAALASSDKVRANVRGLIANFPYWPERRRFHHEISLGLTLDGKPVPREGAPIGMTLDLLGVNDVWGVVADLKTGMVRDHPIERHLYVLGAKALLPSIDHFRFIRVYPIGISQWTYRWLTPRRVEVAAWTGEAVEVFSARGRDPLLKVILDRIEETRPEKATCNLAACEHVYGDICPFAGTTCPSAAFVPAVVSHRPATPQDIAAGLLSLPPERQPGAAFLAMRWGVPLPNTPEMNVLIHQGIAQLRAGTNQISKQLMERSRTVPYKIGDDEYGWQIVESMDMATALRFMTSHPMLFEDMARCVSVSPSSIKHISERKYPGLKAKIMAHCISEGTSERWGKVKRDD